MMEQHWEDLERVEREILATAIDDAARLGELVGQRSRLIVALEKALRGQGDAASYDRLLKHYAAGQALGDRLRQERARVVEAWGESSREQQLLRLLEATRGNGAPRMVVEG